MLTFKAFRNIRIRSFAVILCTSFHNYMLQLKRTKVKSERVKKGLTYVCKSDIMQLYPLKETKE
nr:MAG TPA: hypothetical protein [Caudoviricetes sp.]